MVFLSHILNLPVIDVNGRRVGQLSDLVVVPGDTFPTISAIVVATGRGRLPLHAGGVVVPGGEVKELDRPAIRLSVSADEMSPYEPKEHELRVARDLLDKQIVDTRGRRIVKVNDVKLGEIAGQWRLMGVDIGLRAFLRRLGAEQTADIIGRLLPIRLDERLVTWNYIEPLAAELDNVRLRVSHTQLSELHPADIADIIEQMAPGEGTAVLESLDRRVAAKTLAEIEPELQARLLAELESEHASDLLELLPPDVAADVLAELPEKRAERLLSLMQAPEAADVRELLRYDENTAGGRMTTDVFTLQRRMTVDQTIARLRQAEFGEHDVYYLYVVDEDNHLVGVLSLRALVTAQPQAVVEDLMRRDVTKVYVDTDQEEVARIIGKYNLLAVPVVDEHDVLQGLITVDDVLDVLKEEAEEDIQQLSGSPAGFYGTRVAPWQEALRRLAWLSAAVVGGVAAGAVLQAFAVPLRATLPVLFFLPFILNLSNALGAQSLALAGAGGYAGWTQIFQHEAIVGGLLGVIFGLLIGVASYLWVGSASLGVGLGGGLALAVVAATLLGSAAAALIERTRLDPALASGPVVDAVISVVALTLSFGLVAAVHVA
ncbi:MAG: magnesium transporter [Dehalococcoidales bacterium]|nr:magnesium transporter [Dehalococcoidales bacterium]